MRKKYCGQCFVLSFLLLFFWLNNAEAQILRFGKYITITEMNIHQTRTGGDLSAIELWSVGNTAYISINPQIPKNVPDSGWAKIGRTLEWDLGDGEHVGINLCKTRCSSYFVTSP